MALSNPITWNDMCAEFSLNPATAVFPASFYGKGGAPSSGVLGFQDFVGRSGGGSFTPAPGTYTYNDNGTISGGVGASARVTNSGGSVAWTYSISGFAASCNISSGGSTNSITFSINAAAGASSRSSVVTLSQGANSWTLNIFASGQDALCVSADSLVLMGDGSEKLAGQIVAGDIVYTQHETTGEWMRAEVYKVVLEPSTVYRLRGHPDASQRHRFGFKLFGKVRWYRAGWFGRKARETTVVKLTVHGAHTYMARSPKPGSVWRLCHNSKP